MCDPLSLSTIYQLPRPPSPVREIIFCLLMFRRRRCYDGLVLRQGDSLLYYLKYHPQDNLGK